LINNKLIWECYNNRVSEHLEVKRTENLIWKDAILVIWEIELWNTSLSVIYVEEIRFKSKQYNEVMWIDALNKLWKSVTINFIIKLSLLKNSAWK
jgi:hypothetical protein